MPSYKFYYFPVRARGEAIRLILHYKSIPFEDVRVSKEEWPSKKSSFAFGQMPVLEVDGKQQIAHSWSILRYLANKYGLAGKDECEAVILDQTLELWRDYVDASSPYIAILAGFAQGDKDKVRQEKLLPSLERFAPHFERLLKESGSGYFGRSGVSYVDFYIAEGLYSLYGFEKELMESKYPFLVEHFKRVHALPELQKYLSSRPLSPI